MFTNHYLKPVPQFYYWKVSLWPGLKDGFPASWLSNQSLCVRVVKQTRFDRPVYLHIAICISINDNTCQCNALRHVSLVRFTQWQKLITMFVFSAHVNQLVVYIRLGSPTLWTSHSRGRSSKLRSWQGLQTTHDSNQPYCFANVWPKSFLGVIMCLHVVIFWRMCMHSCV